MTYRNSPPLDRLTFNEILSAMTRRQRFFFWLSCVNLGLFAAIAVSLGGNALNRTVHNGHYFLMLGGVYTEVSRPIFMYSVVHTVSVVITQPIAAIIFLSARFRAKGKAD